VVLDQLGFSVKIRTHTFILYDPDTGEVQDRFDAYCKAVDHLPDDNQTPRIVLKHVDGILDNNLYFNNSVDICREDCYINPTSKDKLKIKKGAEEEFDFFMKNGYHKTGTSND